MIRYRIAKGRVTALLKSRGLYARDAFAAFDLDHDGVLSTTELKRGLEWLGLKMLSTSVKCSPWKQSVLRLGTYISRG